MTRPIVNMLLSMIFLASAGTAAGSSYQNGTRVGESGAGLAPEQLPAETAETAQKAPKAERRTDELRAYALFDDSGREISFEELIDRLAPSEVVFVGEVHNCPITHWLELKIAQALYERHGNSLVMGAEMLESDIQLILDEYMQRLISPDRFGAEARLWDNYETDYHPIVFFAKEHGIPFVATNVPRRYANSVRNHGLGILDSLSDEAKRYLAPLPIPFEYDEEQSQAAFGMMAMLGHGGDTRRLAEAQAVKDATMAWFISRNMNGGKFIHFNGNYHSDFKGGIIPYLERYRPGTRVATIASVRQSEIDRLDEEQVGRADFYICVPEEMTNTY